MLSFRRSGRSASLYRWAYLTVTGQVLLLVSAGIWLVARSPQTAQAGEGEKPSIPATLSMAIQEPLEDLGFGKTAHVTLRITPDRPVARIDVRFTQSGGAIFTSPATVKLHAAEAGATASASAEVDLAAVGRTEIRGWAEAYDADGNQVFAGSRALYLIVRRGHVLAGDVSFTALEIEQLDRDRKAGLIPDEEYKRRVRKLHGGGATESIRIEPPPGASAPQRSTDKASESPPQ